MDFEIIKRLKNLEFDPKTLKPINVKGPLTLEETTYIVETRPKIQLRSKRCEAAYQRHIRRFGNVNPVPNKYNYKLELKLNDYPYNLHPELRHYILWYHGPWETLESEYKKLCRMFNPELFWINLPEHRTISTPHAHIIRKER